jgi:hypothetical protein
MANLNYFELPEYRRLCSLSQPYRGIDAVGAFVSGAMMF